MSDSKIIQNIVSYLGRCYIEDNRQFQLLNIFNKNKVEELQLFETTEELINDHSPKIPIEEVYFEELTKITTLYKKEKELLYCSCFILGEEDHLGKNRKVCAPLLLFPAKLSQTTDAHFVSISKSSLRINGSALRLLIKESKLNADIEDEIISKFPKPPFDFGGIGKITRLLKKYFPKLDTEEMLLFPEVWKLNRIKRQLQPKSLEKLDFFKIVPGSGLGVFSKSSDTYGILSELTSLPKAPYFSKSIHSLFGEKASVKSRKNHDFHLPAILSNSQKEAIVNAQTQDISLVVGPPGTGKSFTIANMAIEHFMSGKSVLITSKQDQAVDVVGKKLSELLDSEDIFIRGGDKRNRRRLQKTLARFLTRKKLLGVSLTEGFNIYSDNHHHKMALHLEAQLNKRLEKEIEWSRGLAKKKVLKKLILKTIHKWRQPHWELLNELNETILAKQAYSRGQVKYAYNKRVSYLLKYHRINLDKMYQAIRSLHSSSDLDTLFKNVDFDILLKALPIWLCKLTDLHRVFPLKQGMFDLLIVDEASQCDMASILPALQRAKKVVFCGDPNQLRHVSFLSRSKMRVLARKFKLTPEQQTRFDFRSTSILDLVSSSLASQEQLSFLNEHFRSDAHIIGFSNSEFYSNDLRIMTEKPISNPDLGTFTVKCEGVRDLRGVNELEAQAIVKAVKEVIDKEKDLDIKLKTSIGILSPFRDQTNFLSKLIKEQLEVNEIVNHEIAIGTSYSFQGEERDSMFLSFVVDKNTHHSSFIHLNKSDVFNVAITRAKNKQFVYHSLDPKDVPQNNYLRSYLERVSDRSSNTKIEDNDISHNKFLNEVIEYLKVPNLKTWIYYSIAGIPIDILIFTQGRYYGIDLIGYPGIYEDALSVERYKILGRTGIPIFPLPYTFWKFDRESCIVQLRKFLNLPDS